MSAPASTRARPTPDTSDLLLARARHGDRSALGSVLGRWLPRLMRWAHNRLDRRARGMAETADVVQESVLHVMPHIDRADLRSSEALGAYLRQAVRNRIRDEHRRLARHPELLLLQMEAADVPDRPGAHLRTSDFITAYRRALERLSPTDQELVVGHVEMGYTHEQLGAITGRKANAARVATQRAIQRLTEQMRDT